MENPIKVIKRAPKWAWVTIAGVTVGAIAIRAYNDRGTDEGVTEGEGPGVGGEEGTVVGGGIAGGGGATGVIVPPIINQPQQDAMIPGIDLITGVVGDLSAGWEALLGPIIANQASINDVVVDALANAGGPPGATVSNPTPVKVIGPVTVTGANPPATPPTTRQCTWKGLTLAQWQNRSKVVRGKRRWAWPTAKNTYNHTRPFAGNSAPDKRPCNR